MQGTIRLTKISRTEQSLYPLCACAHGVITFRKVLPRLQVRCELHLHIKLKVIYKALQMLGVVNYWLKQMIKRYGTLNTTSHTIVLYYTIRCDIV